MAPNCPAVEIAQVWAKTRPREEEWVHQRLLADRDGGQKVPEDKAADENEDLQHEDLAAVYGWAAPWSAWAWALTTSAFSLFQMVRWISMNSGV